MTITKINTWGFKKLCQQAREDYDPDYWQSYREQLADLLRDPYKIDLWSESDEWKAAQATTPATEDELFSMLRFAAGRRMQFGASDAQCRAIAARWAREGASMAQCQVNTLTAAEARAILG